MSKLVKYNQDIVIPAFGFLNIGSTCYFNALMQALLSCTSFISKIEQLNTNNPVVLSFLPYLKLVKNERNDLHKYKQQLSQMSPAVWREMIVKLKQKNIQFGNGQECAREGFHLLMDTINTPEINELFMHRYKTRLLCVKCDDWVSSKECTYSIFDIQPDLKTDQCDMFKTTSKTQNMNEFLLKQPGYVDKNYKCPKCGDQTLEKYQLNSLVMIPEILVVVSKKYNKEKKINIMTDFPENLEFVGNDNFKIKYTAVAQIEHSGGRNGGHYYAICRRYDPRLKKILWYNLNDSNVTMSKFKPTFNTYIVFYHVN
jgi:ubiquitin C-terminal hydrolase